MRRHLVLVGCLFSLMLFSACGPDGDEPTTESILPPAESTSTATFASGSSPVPTETVVATPSGETGLPTETPGIDETPSVTESTPTEPAIPDGTATISIGDQTLNVPAGYTISIFADDLGAARFMALDDEGTLFVTDRLGRVLRLPDKDGDGVADQTEVALDGLNNPHGITFHDGALYVAEETRVIRAIDNDEDGAFETISAIIEGLPEDGHWSRTIRFGPDGMLYLSVGSSCNVCEEEDPRRAAIWRYNADGNGGEPFAVGLRNAVGITFHPDTGELWATNNGRDGMGDNVPPETINQPDFGDDFGWPRCHSGDVIDPQFGSDGACEGVAAPAVRMQAHSAPLGLTFANGEQLAAFSGDLLVAFHGSWNRSEPTGYKVVRVPFENGSATGETHDLVTGWLLPDGDRWGRPVDVIVASDGSLMISDDEAGRIFRLSVAPMT